MGTLKTKIVLSLGATVALATLLAAFNIYAQISLITVFERYAEMARQSNYAASLHEDLLEAHLGTMSWRDSSDESQIAVVQDNLDQIERAAPLAEEILLTPENKSWVTMGVGLARDYGQTFHDLVAVQQERDQVIADLQTTGQEILDMLNGITQGVLVDGNSTYWALIGEAQEKLLISRLYFQKFVSNDRLQDLDRAKYELDGVRTAIQSLLSAEYRGSLSQVNEDLNSYFFLANRAGQLVTYRHELLREGIDGVAPEIKQAFESVVEDSFAGQEVLGDVTVARIQDMMTTTAITASLVILMGLGVAVFLWRSADITPTRSTTVRKYGPALRQALSDPDSDEIFMVLQPKVNLATREIVGCEALARWNSPQGTVSPDVFVPVAERLNIVSLLTRKMIQAGFKAQRQMALAGFDIDVAINLSAIDMENEDVLDLLETQQNQRDRIILELTETAALAAPDKTIPLFHRLRKSGYRIYLDDFGMGYSSLRQLVDMPIDGIKIDRSFVSEIARNPSSAVLVELLSQAGQRLKLKTVAEGIEDDWTAQRVKAIGVTHGQGYHFAKPIPVDTLIEIMRDRKIGAVS